jgi:hypothetical protein
MIRKKSLVSDLLDWKQTYRALYPIQQFLLIGLFALEAVSYTDLLAHNSVPPGNYGVLAFTYELSGNPMIAILVDAIFTTTYLYLSFWFLKKGNETMDFLAYLFFALTLMSSDIHQMIFGV